MGRRTCPRCGAHDRSHEVKCEVRIGGYRSDLQGTGIRVCAQCAVELRDEVKAIFDTARKGICAGLNQPIIEEAEDERREDERILEDAEKGREP